MLLVVAVGLGMMSVHSCLLRCLATLLAVNYVLGGYLITTPRKWTSGAKAQVCIYLTENAVKADEIHLQLFTSDEKDVQFEKKIFVPQGETEVCQEVFTSSLSSHLQMHITGMLAGATVNVTKPLMYVQKASKTFVQTDKFLYKPNQEVQFRILTLDGPFLKISHENYDVIWIENPSRTRISQWNDVDNSGGLIHMSFKLADEPEEGTYYIKVKSKSGRTSEGRFKVEEYVLPRYEVTVKPPPYVLGTDKKVQFTVCAKYTYGEPVKGKLTLTVQNNLWGNYKKNVTKIAEIFGCQSVVVSVEDISSDSLFVYSLTAKAKVVEEGTDVELEGESTVEITRTAINFNSRQDGYDKPELPFLKKVRAQFPDGTPAVGEPIQACCGKVCKNMTIPEDGAISVYIPPHLNEDSLSITALNYPRIEGSKSWASIMHASNYFFSRSLFYSPSNSSLKIHLPDNELQCITGSSNVVIPVMYAVNNQSSAKVITQVVGRGQIQIHNTIDITFEELPLPIDEAYLLEPIRPSLKPTIKRGFFNLNIKLPETISPTAKVLVWFAKNDGEIVSDVLEVKVKECLAHKVDLKWAPEKAGPGEDVTLEIKAEANSLCSLGVVDKSVELLSSDNDDLKLDKIFAIIQDSLIKEWENSQVNDYQYCSKKASNNETDDIPMPRPPPGPFPPPRPIPIINKRSIWRRYYSDYADTLKMFDESGLYAISDLELETRPCRQFSDVYFAFPGEPAPVAAMAGVAGGFAEKGTEDQNNLESGSDVSVTQEARSYFPETWLWKLTMLATSGLDTQIHTLPDTITEWIGKAVCVHPQKGVGISPSASITTFTPFFVDLTLPPSVKRGEILPVKISVFNYFEEPLQVHTVLEPSPEYDILEDNSVEAAAAETGHKMSCLQPQNKVVHTIRIKPKAIGDVNITVGAFSERDEKLCAGSSDAVAKRDILIKPIKVEPEGFPREKTWSKYICSKDIKENADFLEEWRIETPADIVEQSERGWITAVGDLLGPTLEYLEASNQTTKETAEKLIDYMKQGYQRELKYRHADGSFSAFGESDDSGSTWLTAFVVKSFSQARPFIQVDVDDLNKSTAWLKRQMMENGCFQSVGKVLHKEMKGGLKSDSPVPLTAYVLISLLEAHETDSKLLEEVMNCIAAEESGDAYTLALVAYAKALANDTTTSSAIDKLLAGATKVSAGLKWEVDSGNAVAVEVAGYAVLAMMTYDNVKYEDQARQVIKWMSSMRNGQGGFVSTQDTVVALQAMAVFESYLHHGQTDLVITVHGKEIDGVFRINEKNKLLQQMIGFPVIPTNVILDMEGEGCAVVQAVARYNVPAPSASESFSLNVSSETEPDKGCKTKRIKTCTKYLLPEKSNMVVLEVKLVSGYIPEKSDLKQAVGYGTGILKRYEVDGNTVNFYIDELTSKEVCISFRILREIDIENAKPGTSKVYDYYNPDLSVSKSYTLPPADECRGIPSLLPFELDIITGEPLMNDNTKVPIIIEFTEIPVTVDFTDVPIENIF